MEKDQRAVNNENQVTLVRTPTSGSAKLILKPQKKRSIRMKTIGATIKSADIDSMEFESIRKTLNFDSPIKDSKSKDTSIMDDSGVALEFNISNSDLENSMTFTENFEESKKTAKSEVDEMLEKSLQLLENTEIKSSSEPDYFSQIQAHTRSI